VQDFLQFPVAIVAGQTVYVGDMKPALDMNCWGSLLVAWEIRTVVLKFGGVSSVRGKLQPFFVGALAGVVVVVTLLYVVGALATAGGAAGIYNDIP
jgi:succinate-acetate transporter protein